MDAISHVIVLIVVITLILVNTGYSQNRIRWCTVSDPEQLKCEDMMGNFTLRRLSPRLECVQARHRYECMRWVSEGRADLVRMDDTDLFAAGQYYNLTPVVAEKYNRIRDEPPFRYKAVALIKAGGPISSLAALRGRKSCHTGVGKTAGWVVPVSNLVQWGLMTVRDCDSPVKAVGEFFSESCAPGAMDPHNNPNGDNPANVCALCQNPSACSEADVYSGYLGAFRCLHEGGGEVAFVSHTTLNDATSYYVGRGLTAPRRDDFRLLCPDGRVEAVTNWANCSWATRPSDTIVTSASKPTEMASLYRSVLVRAARFFGPGSREFRMFSSGDYGSENLLFSDKTRVLEGVDPERGFRAFMDQGYINTMYNYTNCRTKLRWCVTSSGEEVKCRDMRLAFTANRITRELSCVRSGSANQCLSRLNNNEADLMSAGGSEIYTGGKYHNAVPIASEGSQTPGEGLGGYWGVAVVRKDNPDININNLKGRTSCHTGIGKSVGWNIPVGLLVSRGEITVDACEIPKSVGEFFSRSCIPGALDETYNPKGDNPATMCSMCGGVDKCARNSTNPFYSYEGAFRCFIQFNADVAFVSHTTVPQNTDGRNAQPWARNRRSRDFELLCPDGTRQPVTSWGTCNLGRVPAHAILTRRELPAETRRYFFSVLQSAQLMFGNDTNPKFKLFDSPSNSSNEIFEDSTTMLRWILPSHQTYDSVLGKQYVDTLTALDTRPCSSAPQNIATIHLRYVFLVVGLTLLNRIC